MFKSKTPIGVDIGSHSVKVCQLRRIGELFELEKFGVAEIYPGGAPPRPKLKSSIGQRSRRCAGRWT